MTAEQDQLLRECHEMLSEIVSYVREIQSSEYKNAEDVKQFAINLAANVLVDGMEEKAKDEIMDNFKNEHQ